MNKRPAEKTELIRYVAMLGDFVLLNLTMSLVYAALCHMSVITAFPLQKYLVISTLCYIPCLSVFKIILHYRIVRPEQIVRRLFGTVVLHMIIFMAVISLLKIYMLPLSYLFCFYVIFYLLLVIWRLSLRRWVKHVRSEGKNIRSIILVGNGDAMYELHHELSDVTYGYRIQATFLYKDSTEADYPNNGYYRQEMKRLMEWLPSHPIQEVYCGLPSACQNEVLQLIRYCENNMIRFYMVPSMRNYVKRQLQLTLMGDVPVLSIRREPLQDPLNRLTKRSFDLFCSGLFLITVFPFLYIIVGAIIKLTSPGPIFFKQARNGENGKIFQCYKFRSMKVNKDSDSLQATKDDPRKTKFGNLLRKTNLDEMPQFINVFRGDMSLVGPRPHMLKHTEEYSHLIDKYMMRHLVKPGITGWAQVTGFRGETKELSQMEGRVRRDLWYIENWTFWLDIRIMIMTVANMFKGEKNAY